MSDFHLARGPPAVDFTTLPQRRAERRRDPPPDDRIRRTLRAVDAALKGERIEPQKEEDEDPPPFRMKMPALRPNTSVLSNEEVDKARLSRVSKTLYKEGLTSAQAEIDRGSLRGWTIDGELSTAEGLVVRKGGQTKVAYRGTDWSNVHDVVTNATTAVGVEDRLSTQMRGSRLQIEAIVRKYGQLPSELLGYSKGGAHALAMGDRFKIETTTFNPFVARKQLLTKSDVKHTIIRTTEDPVSSLLALAKGKKNLTVKAIDPIQGLGDPKSVHKLNQFTSKGNRQPGAIKTLMHEGVQKGNMLAHLETLDAMKTGVEQGKTFTQTLDDFNKSNSAVQRRRVIDSLHKEAGTVKLWRASGGTFSPAEQTHLDTKPVPPPRQHSAEARSMGIGQELTTAQTDHVTSMSTQERAAFMRSQRAAVTSHMSSIDASVKPHETVIRNMMPKTTSLATGAVSGLAAHAIMNSIDPDHKMNAVASEATEGAIAGGMGALGASALGASASLGPEILAGAAAYMAATESTKAITSALVRGGMDENTAEGIGGVSGGAIGGVTASAVGTAGTMAGAMLFGTEMGEAIGMVGGPIGMALGAAVGATIGAAIGGIGYLMNHVGNHHHDDTPPPEVQAVEQARQEMVQNTPSFGAMRMTPAQVGNRAALPTGGAVFASRPGAVAARTHDILQQQNYTAPGGSAGQTINITI